MRSKKGICALQLSREMEITHKSALFVLRRIRHGLGYDDERRHEADRHRRSGRDVRRRQAAYRGISAGTGVDTTRRRSSAMVQRGGDVRFRMMERVTSDNLADVLAENASITCRV